MKTLREMHGFKNYLIWISIYGEIERNLERKIDHEERVNREIM